MIVRVYDFLSAEKPKFSQNLVGIVSDVESFKYTRRAYDIGSFEMTIPTHSDEAGCIQPDRMLIVGEKLGQTYIASDPTKRIVKGTFLYVTDIEKKDDKITVTGYDLKYLFALRVTLFPKEEQDKGTYGYYVTSGTTFSCISDIVNYNIVNATDSDRQIYGMFGITMPVNQINADPPLTGLQDDRYMTRLEPVSTAIFNLLKNCKTHFYDMRLIIDDNAEDGDNYNPHMESSEDKPTIIIDESRYNIKSYTRKDGTSAYKNAIYAVVGSGDDVTVKCVKRPDDTASGVKRKEVVLDVDTDSVAEIDRYALKAAEEYVISDDFEIEPLFMDDETEPELAQKVSIRIDGVEYETVITEITDEYANGKHTQSYVCGDKKLKVLNVLNKATAGNTQKIINNKITTGNAGGVGKFTTADKNCEVFNDYKNNVASAYYSHAEGYKTTANAPYSHAEGSNTVASNPSCHAEGTGCVASGQSSHAEGENCRATGSYSHAEGHNTVASGIGSHASGWGTVAGDETFAIGKWNKTSKGLFVVGNGHDSYYGASRSDALVLDSGGNLHISGKLTADGGVGYVLSSATADTLGGVMIGENINVSDTGVISVNLSAYLKSDEISDWAKAESKPVYTAEEVGAAEKNHTHNMSDITDMPEWTKTENKPAYTASEVGLGNVDNTADIDKPISTATQMALDGKDYLKATEITGQVIDLNDIMLNTALDKGKSQRYFCASASAQNISNRPVSATEPFELTVDNIRYVNADAFNSVQRYTSVTRKRSYTRWCDDNIWRAWMCDTDIVIYGTVTSELPKSFDYATYGEGYNQVEIEPYYDNNASPIRNRIVLTLTSATFYDRDVLTVGDSVEHLKIENGTVTMSLTGTKTLSFMIKYTNKRA